MADILIEPIKLVELHEIVFPNTNDQNPIPELIISANMNNSMNLLHQNNTNNVIKSINDNIIPNNLSDSINPNNLINIINTPINTTDIIDLTNNNQNDISINSDKSNFINQNTQQTFTPTKILTNLQQTNITQSSTQCIKILTKKSNIITEKNDISTQTNVNVNNDVNFNDNKSLKLKQIELNNYYLSFDCACATLGYILTEINDVDVDNFFISENIINPKSIKLKIIKQGVINLVEGFLVKDVPVRNQIYNLRVFLDSLIKDIDISKIHVIIEDQPYINDNSNQIQSGLYMYFAYAKSVVSVQPTYKNTICFDKSLDIQAFYEKYSKTYSANKNHAANNLSYYYKIHNIGIDLHKSLYNHLGDAFMQFIYIIKEKVLVVNKSNTIINDKLSNINKVNDINKRVKFNDKPIKVKIPIESKALTINSLINNKTITIKKRNTSDIQSNQTQQSNNIQPIDQTNKENIQSSQSLTPSFLQSQTLQNTNNKSNINKQKKSKHKKKNIDIKHLVLN